MIETLTLQAQEEKLSNLIKMNIENTLNEGTKYFRKKQNNQVLN